VRDRDELLQSGHDGICKEQSAQGKFKLESLGHLLASAEPFRELAEEARARSEAGESEEHVLGSCGVRAGDSACAVPADDTVPADAYGTKAESLA
jgi:hypothetical protein